MLMNAPLPPVRSQGFSSTLRRSWTKNVLTTGMPSSSCHFSKYGILSIKTSSLDAGLAIFTSQLFCLLSYKFLKRKAKKVPLRFGKCASQIVIFSCAGSATWVLFSFRTDGRSAVHLLIDNRDKTLLNGHCFPIRTSHQQRTNSGGSLGDTRDIPDGR